MITKMFLEPGKQIQGHKRTYLGGPDGLVADIDQGDFPALLAGGARPAVIPKTLNLVVSPEQALHFASHMHTADKHGIIPDVPWDDAVIMINDQSHPARLASDQEMAAAGYLSTSDGLIDSGHLVEMDADELGELRAMAAQAESVMTALSAKFGGAEIVDTGETVGPHSDMIFTAERDGVEIARGTVTELFAVTPPVSDVRIVAETPAGSIVASDGKPVADGEPDTSDDDQEGDPLPETSTVAE